MALQGTLDTFALPDVLRLLAATAKTGCLQIEGDRGRGVVWVAEGRVLAANADRAQEAPLDEAVFELLRYGTGSFRFAVDATAASVGGDRHGEGHGNGDGIGNGIGDGIADDVGDDIEATLLRAMALLDEWHALEPVVPSMSHGVTLVDDLPREHVTIDAGTWRVLATVASGRSVGDLAHDLGVGELEVSRLVYGMVQLGVVSVNPPGASATPTGGHAVPPEDMSLQGSVGLAGAWSDPAATPGGGNGERAPRRRSSRNTR